MDISNQALRNQYNLFPFPAEPIQKGAPKVWDHWRDYTLLAYTADGRYRTAEGKRLLDAGCGTGYGLWHLAAQNPGADIVAFDISSKTVAMARERLKRGGVKSVPILEADGMDLSAIEGQFNLIISVGLIHHLADPEAGLRNLAGKLKDDGLIVLYLYSSYGRWQIAHAQKAIQMLREDPNDFIEGLRIGRTMFDALPGDNALAQYGRKMERMFLRDEAFVDTFVTAREHRYNISEVFSLLDRVGLEFVRFSDEPAWKLERLLRDSPPLLKKADKLTEQQRYELADVLNPTRNAYHFLARKKGSALPAMDKSDDALLKAIPHRREGLTFDMHDGRRCVSFLQLPKIIRTYIDEMVEGLLQAADGQKTTEEIIKESKSLPRLLQTDRTRRLLAAFKQLEERRYILFEQKQ